MFGKQAKVEIQIRPFNMHETNRKCVVCQKPATYWMTLAGKNPDPSSRRPVCIPHSTEWVG
jgi:hypothetical protein